MATAKWMGQILAESNATVTVEGNHYFPPDSVRREYFKTSPTRTECAWKGTASYYTIEVGGKQNTDAAWFYPQPKPEAAHIRDYVAFWKGVDVTG